MELCVASATSKTVSLPKSRIPGKCNNPMQLTQRPFAPGIPGYLLTIGQHSMLLMEADLFELATLVARALEKLAPDEDEQATTARLQEQLAEKRKRGRKPGNLCKTLRELDLDEKIVLACLDDLHRKRITNTCCQVKGATGHRFSVKSNPYEGTITVTRIE